MIVDHEQIAGWNRDGWLHLPGALSAEQVAELDRWVGELESWAAAGGPGLHHFEMTDAGPTIARSEMYADDHDGLGALVRGRLIGAVLEDLFGEPGVLFKEKINYKRPGGAGFAPHQDAAAYRFVDHHISVMVPLDPMTERSGCLHLAPGHAAGKLPTDDRGRLEPEVVADLDWRPIEAAPGDLLFFDSYTPHHSGTNETDHPRRALYLTYNAASRGDHRARYYEDKLEEFEAAGGTFDEQRVRISISDDFLGKPVTPSG